MRHEEFLSKLDNALHGLFFSKYSDLHKKGIELLRMFNAYSGLSCIATTPEEFRARIVRYEKIQNLPTTEDRYVLAEFLLPKILSDMSDATTMRRLVEWINSLAS